MSSNMISAYCGGQIDVEDSLRLTSPNYPLSYPERIDCVWKLRVPMNYHVALKFETFKVRADINGKMSISLKVYLLLIIFSSCDIVYSLALLLFTAGLK